MGTKIAVSFANIVTAEIETDTINQSPKKTLIWKRYIDDIFFSTVAALARWPLIGQLVAQGSEGIEPITEANSIYI